MQREDNSPIDLIKSDIHGAFQQSYRIDALWQRAHNSLIEGNYNKYNIVLSCIWTEVSPILIEQGTIESKKLLKDYKDNEEELAKLGNLAKPNNTGFNKPSLKQIATIGKQSYFLEKKSIIIRLGQNISGLGAKYAGESLEDV